MATSNLEHRKKMTELNDELEQIRYQEPQVRKAIEESQS
jgi:hypothetical protein